MSLHDEKAAALTEILAATGEEIVWKGRTLHALVSDNPLSQDLGLGGFNAKGDCAMKALRSELGADRPMLGERVEFQGTAYRITRVTDHGPRRAALPRCLRQRTRHRHPQRPRGTLRRGPARMVCRGRSGRVLRIPAAARRTGRDDLPIAEQFLIETRITKRIVGGNDRKLMLTRGFQCLARGHHSMPNERRFARTGRVLHYKWNSAVLDHLAERLALREQTGYQWGHESERFLAYWKKNGRFIFTDCL